MKTTNIFLMTAVTISLSGVAMAQTATQVQQQKTEAAAAGQATKTNAAAQGQSQKTQAASAEQAAQTQSATQDQAQRTQAASQKQAAETAAAVQNQPGQPQLNQPQYYINPPISNGEAVIYGAGAAAGTTATPRVYNTGLPNNAATGQISPANTAGGANISTPPAERQLQDLFNKIDTDRSGMITKTEFSMYYSSLPDDPRFDSYDTNRDMMISYFEFRSPNVSGASVSIPSH